jgi:hypothetical protein
MISWGRTPEDIVDSIISGLSAEMKLWAQESGYIREILIRATRYAGIRLRDQAKNATAN